MYFIDEADALRYCMEKSVYSFRDYERLIAKMPTNLAYNNFLNAIPDAITRSIVENIEISKTSKLYSEDRHFLRDLTRNIAETEVLKKAAECIENGIPMQLAFDKKGTPMGDAAEIANGVLDGIKSVQEGFGEQADVEIDDRKILFNEVGNRNVAISPDKGIVAINKQVTKVTTADRVQ